MSFPLLQAYGINPQAQATRNQAGRSKFDIGAPVLPKR